MENKNKPVDITAEIVRIAKEHGFEDDQKILAMAQKCYNEISWRPYGGAKSFAEIDKNRAAQDYSLRVEDETYKLRALIENITMDEELDTNGKTDAIQSVASEYKSRVQSLEIENVDKSFLEKLKSFVFGESEDEKIIKHEGDKWNLYSKDGKKLGSFDSKEAAQKRERQINFFKNQDKESSEEPLPTVGKMKVYEDKEGNLRWLAVSSNSFEDRDKEIITSKALEEAIDHADKTGERGPLLYFHVPSAEIGQTDYQAMVGRFLIESGTFLDTPIGQKAVQKFREDPQDYQVSIGYKYIVGDEQDGQLDWLRIRERSVCPNGTAANPWTEFVVIGENAMDEVKVAELEKFFGKEMAVGLINAAEQRTKTLEDAGVRHKEATTGSANTEGTTATTVAVVETDSKGEVKSVEVADEKKEETQAAEAETPAPQAISLTVDQLQEALAPFKTALETLGQGLNNVQEEVKALKASDDEKIARQIAPRYSPNGGKSAAESTSNVLSEEAVKAILGKDAETSQPTNPARAYVDDLLGANKSN